MSPFLENIKAFLSRLSLGQKMAIGMVTVGAIGVFTGIAYWAGQPDYALLFGSLDPGDANKVVEALQSERVKYEIKDGGTAIYVPREDVYELRLRFAGEGLVSDGPVGYELFDRGTLGMTDFMQKLNLKRALEGELARTISNIRQVDICRVHLVMPDRSPFRETQTQPSASVVIQLSGGSRLATAQIEGITQLVSGAVEGLSPSDVTILDTRGNLLSNPNQGDENAMITSTQLRYQTAVESHLTEKGQTMLDQIVGPGNAIVRVSATIDFSRRVSESNSIDPESATVIAEERMDQEGGADTAAQSIKNYELSRTIERTESSSGQISFLTVSVILNANRGTAAGAEGSEPQPAADVTQLTEVESIVKNAVGFQPDRGDRFAIHQTSFDTSMDERISSELREQLQDQQMQVYLRYGLMALALLAALWLLRSATKKFSLPSEGPIYLNGPLHARSLGGGGGGGQVRGGKVNELAAHDGDGDDEDELVMVDDFYSSRLSPEAKARLKAKHLMFEEIKKQVSDTPDSTADLLRNWLLEDTAVRS